MLSYWLILSVLLVLTQGSFLKCSASDSLESIDDLDSDERAEKQGYVCDEWPFYAGGFPAHSSSSSSSSSDDSSDDGSKKGRRDDDSDDDSSEARQRAWKRSEVGSSEISDYDDTVISSECIVLSDNGNYCSRWVTMKIEKESESSSSSSEEKNKNEKEFELCICANGNHYCDIWACLEIDDLDDLRSKKDYEEINLDNALSLPIYSLFECGNEEDHKDSDGGCSGKGHGDDSGDRDGHHHRRRRLGHGSSSDDSDDGGHDSVVKSHNHYCFTDDLISSNNSNSLNEIVNGDFRNCWCNSENDDGTSCMNWYCESFSKNTKTVDDHGWFGCYPDTSEALKESRKVMNALNISHVSHCNAWYGFMQDLEEREDYRCVCDFGIECHSWHCGVTEYDLRRNEMWYNFYLALFLWAFMFGCFGTCCCYRCSICNRRRRCDDNDDECCEKYDAFITNCQSQNKWKVIRMTVFYCLIGFASIVHGGVPCFLFFIIFASIAQCCAIKKERCKNCKCSKKRRCGINNNNNNNANTTTNSTTVDGENSKEEESMDSASGNGNVTTKMVRIPSEESV